MLVSTIETRQNMVEIDGGLIASYENDIVGFQSDSVPENLLKRILILSDSSGSTSSA